MTNWGVSWSPASRRIFLSGIEPGAFPFRPLPSVQSLEAEMTVLFPQRLVIAVPSANARGNARVCHQKFLDLVGCKFMVAS